MRLRGLYLACAILIAGMMQPGGRATAAPMTLRAYMALNGPAGAQRIAYGAGQSQFMEFYKPRGAGPFPVAVLIHGGCFREKFAGFQQMRPMAAALSAQGLAVFNVEYRRADEAGGGYPGTYDDAAKALALVLNSAGALNYDPKRLVLVGHSAGGYLALWLAGRPRLAPPDPLYDATAPAHPAVVSLGYAGDFRGFAPSAQICGLPFPQLTGPATAARPQPRADTADLLPAPGSKIILGNGEFDALSPPTKGTAFAAELRRQGLEAQAVMLQGDSHYGEVSPASSSWPMLQRLILSAAGVPEK